MSLFDLFDFTKELIAKLGYFGVFLGTFLEAVFPPIPSEVIMGFAGFLISEGKFQWGPVLFSAILGNAVSVSLIWVIGKYLGKAVILKWGKFVGITAKDIEKGEELFKKHGYKMVLVCQMIPLARTTIAFPAGILNTKYWKFIIFNTLGASVWLTLLAIIGYNLGNNWDSIETLVKPFETALKILLFGVIIFIIYKFFKYKKTSTEV